MDLYVNFVNFVKYIQRKIINNDLFYLLNILMIILLWIFFFFFLLSRVTNLFSLHIFKFKFPVNIYTRFMND